MIFHLASYSLDLRRPRIMAVLNLTPDSFSDGGQFYRGSTVDVDACLRRAESMLAEGADILDLGGESTRPGAQPVSSADECARVLPVLEALLQRFAVPVSIDTSNPVLMREAALCGAAMINDVRALSREGALEAVAGSNVALCLMHMQGEPDTMQEKVRYTSVVDEVKAYLRDRVQVCENRGHARSSICIDPGIGFGKHDEHNLALLGALEQFADLQCPILFGVSRKSMIGRLLGRELSQRLAGSLAFAQEALHRGAKILRVHDVAATRDLVEVFQLLEKTKDFTA